MGDTLNPKIQSALRALPSVDALLNSAAAEEWKNEFGIAQATKVIQQVLGETREDVLRGRESRSIENAIAEKLTEDHRGRLHRVINATGVIIHTNLGRAPLAPEAVAAMVEVGAGYSNLEYDLSLGKRKNRHGHAGEILCDLTGAEGAVVVNNCAAAMLLALSALAEGKEVIVSRGELVEIGGGFRIPEILSQSGARLVEVGTTNRTRAADYEKAITEDTALILKVHPSNFSVHGFTEEVSLQDLKKISRRHKLTLVYDAGAGSMPKMERHAKEPSIQKMLQAGADLICFSGDKLLGGPQAGIIVGAAEWVQKIKVHPLMRALRPDKLCLAALVATLKLWQNDAEGLPVMPKTTAELQQRAESIVAKCAGCKIEPRSTKAKIGGGSSPDVELASVGLFFEGDPDSLHQKFRDVSVVGRVREGHFILDLMSVLPNEDDRLIEIIQQME